MRGILYKPLPKDFTITNAGRTYSFRTYRELLRGVSSVFGDLLDGDSELSEIVMRHATEKDLKILEKLEFGGDIGLDDVAELSANEFTSLLKLNAKWNIRSFGELLVRDAKVQMRPKKGVQTLQRPAFEVRIQN